MAPPQLDFLNTYKQLAQQNPKKALAALLVAVILSVKLFPRGPSSKKSSASAIKDRKGKEGEKEGGSSSSSSRRKKVQVDGVFLGRLMDLLKVCVPSVVSVETFLFSLLTVFLVIRTRLTIIIAETIGENAKHLVNRQLWKFISGVVSIGLWALPSSVINSGIKYTTQLLEQRFRANLQLAMHKQYLSAYTVYNIATKSGQIDNPDHRLTQDMLHWCTEVTEVYPSLFKPLIDVVTFIYQLSKNGGVLPPSLMVAYYVASGFLMRALMPNFAKITAKTAQKEGDFRAVHAQIIQHAEEVAFYRGETIERHNADAAADSLTRHHMMVKKQKWLTDFMDAVLIKYGATCVGYAVCSIGVFELKGKVDTSELTRVYMRSSQLYIPLARAIGKIVMLHKKITALAGYTSRVAELREMFEMIHAKNTHVDRGITEVRRGDSISVKDVDVVAPGGSVLLKDLTFTVNRQEHLLIMGNNGSGKTALMRVLAGLWPMAKGTVTRPPMDEIFFLPQRTYLPKGTLRQQLIFPAMESDAAAKGISDQEILQMADDVGLSGLIKREGGLDSVKEWTDVLSGGERQRVALVRVLYHRPDFALLDECTSAVSQDIEPELYVQVKKRGVTLITVSHREALRPLHTHIMALDGYGGFEISKIEQK